MRILFTGASSFTGYWFVKELSAAGHEVVAVFRRGADAYRGTRRARVELVGGLARAVFNCGFGDEPFMRLIERESRWDLLCHHAADVTDYKSPAFDIVAALQNNTRNLPEILAALRRRECRRVLLTGSVFECGEGAGSEGLRAVSPYGVSKALTAQVFVYHAHVQGMRLGKFVIPNPFGPYEEPRFASYLVRSWQAGRAASVATPAYVRDNIHVSLLAKAYADFAGHLDAAPGFQKLNPSGYVESQSGFACRFAREMRARLRLPCDLDFERQTDFPEPRIRINFDPVDGRSLGWDERAAWDELAGYYAAPAATQLGDQVNSAGAEE